MSEFRQFLQWLRARPDEKGLRNLLPFPRFFWPLLGYVAAVIIGYKTSVRFTPPGKGDDLAAFYGNLWFVLTAALFFLDSITHSYLAIRFPSGKRGILSQFTEGKWDSKNPVVKFYRALVILTFLTFLIGAFQFSQRFR